MKERAFCMYYSPILPSLVRSSALLGLALLLSQCAGTKVDQMTNVVVSVKEQKLAIYTKDGAISRSYPVSTSKYGLNDKPGTFGTPAGLHEVVAKIGHGVPPGSVFKSRELTGEVLKPDAPGRDPIVTRIMWLRGLEPQNRNAYRRCIYIHGTAEERNVGKPVSYGCIRMKSRDVIDLFNRTGIGSRVLIVQGGLPTHVPAMPVVAPPTPPSEAPPIFLNPNQQPQGPLLRPEPPQQLLAENAPRKRFLSALLPFAGSSSSSERSGAVPDASGPISTETSPSEPASASFKRGSASSAPLVASTDAAPEAAPPGVEPAAPYHSRQMQNGATVIYAAPGTSGTAPIVLKSRRTASQNISSR